MTRLFAHEMAIQKTLSSVPFKNCSSFSSHTGGSSIYLRGIGTRRRLVQRYFSDIVVTIAESRVPIHLGIMPKWAGDEALEVADFIVQAAGQQARRWDTGDERFRRDFESVFQATPLWSSFQAIQSLASA